MAININNKVSSEDIEAARNANNGGGVSYSDDELDDFFDSSDDLFSDFDNSGNGGGYDFGGDSMSDIGGVSYNNMQQNAMGGNTVGGFGYAQNQTSTVSQPKSKTDEALDKAIDTTVDTAKEAFSILKQIIKSTKYRTMDDFGYFATICIKIGSLVGGIGLVTSIIGWVVTDSESLQMIFINALVCGMIVLSCGIATLFVSAYLAEQDIRNNIQVDEIPDIQDNLSDISGGEFDDVWDGVFEEDSDNYEESEEYDYDEDNTFEYDNRSTSGEDRFAMFNTEETSNNISLGNTLDSVMENAILTRKYLVDTFRSVLPLSTPKFHEKNEIYSSDEQFSIIEAICLKALSNLANCDLVDINSKADRMYETVFSYEIYITRIKKLSNLQAIEREVEAYFRENSEDYAVTAKVDIEGDYYKIIVSKGESPIVTLGDVLSCQEYYDKFIDEKLRLPIIYGIDELGNICMGDGKECDSTMIAGKQRSGKSWYLLGMIMTLMLFNSPERVQFIIIDPKDTALFKVISWMPHVAGLHTAKNILNVLDDVIDNEGAYRKQLLKNHMCDTIWELWDKGIYLPILYICIDEYITARDSLGERAKELNEKLLVIKTQFPSQGIRVIFIPHRATGVVDKTNRATTSLKVAVRTEIEDTRDTVGETKWSRPLVNPGDMAMRAPGMMKAEFMRGVTISRSDSENREIIETAAKAFYKMGVDMPDMRRMPIACNRNAEEIRAELSGESTREQYNANSIYSMLDD